MPRLPMLLLCSLPMCLTAAGCGSRLPDPPDPQAGMRALETALDGWKAGRSPRELREQQPRIHVADEDWVAGWGLTAYDIDGDPLPHGVSMSYPVALSLQSPQGRPVQKRVRYAVAVEPSISITRQD